MTAGTVQRLSVVSFVKPAKLDAGLLARVGDADSVECQSALWWLLDGAVRFRKEGLGDTPDVVVQGTEDAHHGYDPIAAWLHNHTESGTGGELLGRMLKAGVEVGKATAGSISKRARRLGWTQENANRSGVKRPALIPPTRASAPAR